MKTKKHLLASTVLLASVTVPAYATTIDELLAQAQRLEQQITLGVQGAAGAHHYAHQGTVIADGTVTQGRIEQAWVDAYNQALQDVQYDNYNTMAEEVINAAVDDSMTDLHAGIDDLVDAVTDMSTVFAVADKAEEAQIEQNETGDIGQQEALQEYIDTNDVQIETADVDQYNESLETIENAAQSAAVFISVAQDQEFMDGLNEDLQAFNAEAGSVQLSYNSVTDEINATFMNNATMAPDTLNYFDVVQVTLAQNFKQSSDVLLAGQQEGLYTSFIGFRESGGRTTMPGYSGPPPNVLLFNGNPSEGGFPDAYTDANGNIIEYQPGDEVYDPYDNTYVGKWNMDGTFTWAEGVQNRYCGGSC